MILLIHRYFCDCECGRRECVASVCLRSCATALKETSQLQPFSSLQLIFTVFPMWLECSIFLVYSCMCTVSSSRSPLTTSSYQRKLELPDDAGTESDARSVSHKGFERGCQTQLPWGPHWKRESDLKGETCKVYWHALISMKKSNIFDLVIACLIKVFLLLTVLST